MCVHAVLSTHARTRTRRTSPMRVQAAFRKANTAANNVYETPPKTITYPASKGSKLATWTLKKHESGMWVYKEESGKVSEGEGVGVTRTYTTTNDLCLWRQGGVGAVGRAGVRARARARTCAGQGGHPSAHAEILELRLRWGFIQ